MGTDWVVLDLDGTLCDDTHRIHLLHVKPRNWDRFHEELEKDTPKKAIVSILNAVTQSGLKTCLCTGRPETYRDRTHAWLHKNGIRWDRLLMRPEMNFVSATIVKPTLWADAGLTVDNVLFILEDSRRMVVEWRRLGFTCLQVEDGE